MDAKQLNMLTIRDSRSEKANVLFNLIGCQSNIAPIY